MSLGVLVNIRANTQNTQGLARLVRCYRNGYMREKSFRSAADDPEPISVSYETKCTRVVNDSNDRMVAHSRVRLLNVTVQQSLHRHLRVSKEAIQSFAVSNRCHLVGEAIPGRYRRQRDDSP